MPKPPKADIDGPGRGPGPGPGPTLDTDTIVAIATASGQAGVGVVRLSGPLAHEIGRRVAPGSQQAGRFALRRFRDADGVEVDSGLVLRFDAPRSYTGEDVVELQGHGGPVLLQMLQQAAIDFGARLARPGEFTERAFANGKLDLAQAEAVADLIAGASEQAVRGAQRSLAGEFSARIHAIDADVIRLRTFVEAAIDFADEDIELLEQGQVRAGLKDLAGALAGLRAESAQGVLLRDGITLALVGAPNVGKSSLLNQLAGEARAIVTDVPGTTRDLIRAELNLDGLPVEVVDTAGLRQSEDVVEQAGVALTREMLRTADIVLWLCDATEGEGAGYGERDEAFEVFDNLDERGGDRHRLLRVLNKIDLVALEPGVTDDPDPEARVSALTGDGVAALKQWIQQAVGFHRGETRFTARRRHLNALDQALAAVEAARAFSASEIEFAAEELRLAHIALGEIVGAMTPDELLGEIFSSFCIGK